MCTKILYDTDLVAEAEQLASIDLAKANIRETPSSQMQLDEQAMIRNLRGQLHWEGDLMMLRASRVEIDESDNSTDALGRLQ